MTEADIPGSGGFNPAQKLWNPTWGAERNIEVFGTCANEDRDGHDYDVFVTVKGVSDSNPACIIDVKHRSSIVKERVLDKVDHGKSNLDAPFLKDKIPSTEMLPVVIWNEICEPVKANGCTLHRVELVETDK